MKEQLLTLTGKHLTEIAAVQKATRYAATPRIRQRTILAAGLSTSRRWFDEVRPALERAAIQPNMVSTLSDRFEVLLRMCQMGPMKTVLLPALAEIFGPYKELIHIIEIGSFSHTGGLSIAPYIEGLPSDEGE